MRDRTSMRPIATLRQALTDFYVEAVEKVIVHELLHMIEKKHNEKFVNMLAKYIPKWRSIKEELNRSMLSHEEWNY